MENSVKGIDAQNSSGFTSKSPAQGSVMVKGSVSGAVSRDQEGLAQVGDLTSQGIFVSASGLSSCPSGQGNTSVLGSMDVTSPDLVHHAVL